MRPSRPPIGQAEAQDEGEVAASAGTTAKGSIREIADRYHLGIGTVHRIKRGRGVMRIQASEKAEGPQEVAGTADAPWRGMNHEPGLLICLFCNREIRGDDRVAWYRGYVLHGYCLGEAGREANQSKAAA